MLVSGKGDGWEGYIDIDVEKEKMINRYRDRQGERV